MAFKNMERFGSKSAKSSLAPNGPDPMTAIIQENKALKAELKNAKARTKKAPSEPKPKKKKPVKKESK